MANIDINSYITIFISLIAVIIAILGYLDNRKNIKIVKVRENEKNDIRNILKELKETSDTLKEFPDYTYFDSLPFIIYDISREVYENETLSLKFEFQGVQSKHFSVDPNSITAKSLRNLVKKVIDINKKGEYCGYPSIKFMDNPDVISDKQFDLNEFMYIFAKIEGNISKLNEFEYLIDSFDSEILKMIEKPYEKIFELLADIFHKKVYSIEFNRNMKPSEIEEKMEKMVNYEQILDQSTYLSTDVASRIDELRRDLSKQILI